MADGKDCHQQRAEGVASSSDFETASKVSALLGFQPYD
jgi:hypothetical protein